MRSSYRIADDVAWVSLDHLDNGDVPSAYVARIPVGRPITLAGPACLVWLALADGGTVQEITDAVAEMTDADREEIERDVALMIDHLVASGLAAGG